MHTSVYVCIHACSQVRTDQSQAGLVKNQKQKQNAKNQNEGKKIQRNRESAVIFLTSLGNHPTSHVGTIKDMSILKQFKGNICWANKFL